MGDKRRGEERKDVPTESVIEVAIDLILDGSKGVWVWVLARPLMRSERVG